MRVNIDEKWKADPRRKRLAKMLGSERLADGMLIEVTWVLFAHKGEGVPLSEFRHIENHEDWIAVGLGRIEDEWVRIAGSSRYEEYFQKQAHNGSKGGRPKKNPKKPNVTQTKPEKPSSSSSFSSSKNSEEGEGVAPAALAIAPGKGKACSLEALLTSIPPAGRDEMIEGCRRYGGKNFFEAAARDAFTYHSVRPEALKFSVADWVSKINAAIEFAKKKAPAPFIPSSPRTRTSAEPDQIEIPVVTAAEVLSNGAAAKFKLGPALAVLERTKTEAG